MDSIFVYMLVGCNVTLLAAVVALAFCVRGESKEWRHHVQYLTDANRALCALLRRHVVPSIPAESIAMDPAALALFSVDRYRQFENDGPATPMLEARGATISHGDINDLIDALDERKEGDV